MSPPAIPDHELLASIGHGSSGEVWLARNVMGQGRAVKLMRGPPGRGMGREYAAVQLYEPVSRGADGLVHVLHVGRLTENGDASGTAAENGFFYIMELADDFGTPGDFTGFDKVRSDPLAYTPHTLRAELKREGSLSVPRCIEIGLALSAALLALHQAGLLHRDIKPSNIIFVHGRAKLADMGLLAGVEEAPSLVGTEGYLPPDGPGRPAGDLYALGMVLYEAATGLHPSDYPRLPEAWGRGENPAALELLEVIFHATEADSRRRYTQASALLADLAALANGTSLRSARQLRERLAWAKKSAIAAVFAAGLAGAGLWLWKDSAVREARTQAAESHSRAQALVAARERAGRLLHTGWMGDVMEARRVLGEALHANPEDQLTAEALAAALLAPDFVVERRWQSAVTTGKAGLTMTPDGAWLARHAADGRIEIVAAADEAMRCSFSPQHSVSHVGPFAPGGRFLHLALSEYRRHAVWDVSAAPPVLVSECHLEATFTGFSTDGTRAAFWHRDRMELEWRSLTGDGASIRAPVPQAEGAKVFPSPDGQWWLIDSPNHGLEKKPRQQLLMEAATGKVVATASTTFYTDTFAWAPAENAVALSSHDGPITILHTIPGWPPVLCFGHSDSIVALAFSPDGRWLLSSSFDNTVRLWDTATGYEALRLSGWCFALDFLADGKHAWRAVEAVQGMEALELLSWTPPLVQTLPAACVAGDIGPPRWHPNGRWLAVDVGADLWWWRAADLARVRRDTLPAAVNAMAFFPQNGDLALCSAPGGGEKTGVWWLRPQTPPDETAPPFYQLSECLCPGNYLSVEPATDGTLLLRDEAYNGTLLRPGQPPVPLSGHNNFWGIAISPDGRHLATSRWNEPNVLFFDGSAQRAGKFATELCTQPVFSPDGARLFAVDQDVICAWDTAAVQPLWRTPRDRAQLGAGWCAVSPDSRWLAATLDEAPALLDTATGTVRLRLTTPGHARADRFTWSPDGRQLAARLVRGGLVVWQTGALLDILHGHGALRDVTPGPLAP